MKKSIIHLEYLAIIETRPSPPPHPLPLGAATKAQNQSILFTTKCRPDIFQKAFEQFFDGLPCPAARSGVTHKEIDRFCIEDKVNWDMLEFGVEKMMFDDDMTDTYHN